MTLPREGIPWQFWPVLAVEAAGFGWMFWHALRRVKRKDHE